MNTGPSIAFEIVCCWKEDDSIAFGRAAVQINNEKMQCWYHNLPIGVTEFQDFLKTKIFDPFKRGNPS